MNFIFDMDGTLTDPTHRHEALSKGTITDEEYAVMLSNDPPINASVTLARSLARDHRIHIITSRPALVAQNTARWLKAQGIKPDSLWFRGNSDLNRSGCEVKEGLLQILLEHDYLTKKEPCAAFEDDLDAVRMYARYDIPTYTLPDLKNLHRYQRTLLQGKDEMGIHI